MTEYRIVDQGGWFLRYSIEKCKHDTWVRVHAGECFTFEGAKRKIAYLQRMDQLRNQPKNVVYRTDGAEQG